MDENYKAKQSNITKVNWEKGIYNFKRVPHEIRICKLRSCNKYFKVKPSNSKIYCSKSCAAKVNNAGRKLSISTKRKISVSVAKLPKKDYSWKMLPKVELRCLNCDKLFLVVPYIAKTRKYCSVNCAIKTIGSMTTSPKASKGKSGIRNDINEKICFYSTWEANVARVFNLVGVKWDYAPTLFSLGEHTYRPDFYLPEYDIYIEVKNYMGGYSLKRDINFRRNYPNIKLEIIGKKEYQDIKTNYRCLISNWER